MSLCTWGSLTRKMYPQPSSALDFWQLALPSALLSAGKLAFPPNCFCGFLISSEAASCHSELPPWAGQVISWAAIIAAGILTPSSVASMVALMKPSFYCMGPFTASKWVHFCSTCKVGYFDNFKTTIFPLQLLPPQGLWNACTTLGTSWGVSGIVGCILSKFSIYLYGL